MAKLGRGARLHLVARKGRTGLSSHEPTSSVARSHAKPQPRYRSIPWSIERLKPRSRPRGLAYRSSECVCRGAPTFVIGCAVANARRSALAGAADSGRQRVLCGDHRDVVGGQWLIVVGDDRTEQLTCVLAATTSHDMRCVCWFLGAPSTKRDAVSRPIRDHGGFPVRSAMSSVLISECGGSSFALPLRDQRASSPAGSPVPTCHRPSNHAAMHAAASL